jgi:hypothetical protein
MYIRQLSNGLTRVHMHDEDDYNLCDDKGVDVDFSPEQLLRLVRFAARGRS